MVVAMSLNIDHSKARKILDKAWVEIHSDLRPPPQMQHLIEQVLSASDVAFKYILVTAFLAKCVNRDIHARALQAGSSLNGAYDARSLCHKLVVGYEKSKGNLFGLSNEPFGGKPARHPEHREDNPQLRNKTGAKALHQALEAAQSAKPSAVFMGLVHILRLGAAHAANQKQVVADVEVNLLQVLDFIRVFLRESDGGCRLVGVWGAFQALMCENGKVKVYSPNSADFFAKTSGDVEVYYGEVLVSASECKQRPLHVDDVNHGIMKAMRNGVPEYLFVISEGFVNGHEGEARAAIERHNRNIDLGLINIWQSMETLAALLNPNRRARFGVTVVDLLRVMRKHQSANIAAELWNSITN